MREELKQFIGWTHGIVKLGSSCLAMEGKIRKERQDTLYNQARRRRKSLWK
jgi:hypothetical protein